MSFDRKSHWDTLYATKSPHEVGWTQELPVTSMDFIHQFNLPKSASIIDIGGGDSKLVDCLINKGYFNITVLDISKKALEKTQLRLGSEASHVRWVISDILDFKPEIKYDLWHDRATFHFFTELDDIKKYIDIAIRSISGYLIMATFSDKGPEKCSGLDIRQYSEQLLHEGLSDGFKKIRCLTEDHITPFNIRQNYLFCSFKRTT